MGLGSRSKLEGMFKDMELSRYINVAFKQQMADFKETAEQKTVFTYNMDMQLWNKQTMPATRIAFQDRKLDEEVVTDGGKQGTIIQEKVDVEKSASENDAINQHKAVEEDIDKETAVTRMLFEEERGS